MSKARGQKVFHPRKEQIIPQAPPLYPLGGCKPLPLPRSDANAYLESVAIEHEISSYVKSNFGVQIPKSPGQAFYVDRYTDSYPDCFKIENTYIYAPINNRLPIELRPNAPKPKVDKKKLLEERAKRKFEELTKKNDKDIEEGDEEEEKPVAKKPKVTILEEEEEEEEKEDLEDDPDKKIGDEVEEDEVDEELDEGTDYARDYFDNGEDYLDSDGDNEDGPIY